MSLFKFKKIKNKEQTKMTTLEEVRKAYQDLSEDDKKKFHQSLSDRVHESIAAQERANGEEDSESAEAREHEALGAEHADGYGEVEELHEKDDTAEERAEDKAEKAHEEQQDGKHEEHDAWREEADKRFAKIEEALAALMEKKGSEDKLDKAREKYGLAAKAHVEEAPHSFSFEEINKLI